MLNMSFLLNRRQFLKVAGLTTGAVVAGSGSAFASLPQRRTTLIKSTNNTPLPTASATKVATTCTMCSNYCGAQAIVGSDGRVRRLEPLPGHPNGRDGLCAKGQASVQQLYDPDRLKAPVRKKADGSWEELTWDAAIAHTALKLQTIRNGGIAPGPGVTNNTATGDAAGVAPHRVFFLGRRSSAGTHFTQFRREFGSSNFATAPPVCDGAKRTAQWLAAGNVRLVRDQVNAKYTILLGRNELEAVRYRLGYARELVENLKAGGHLVVVDPRKTYTASKAHEYVGVKPGTDLMFILSMCHVIVTNNLQDTAWISANSAGFADFATEVSKAMYAPSAAEAVCGVPAEVITRLAKEFAGVIDPVTKQERAKPADWIAVADTTSGLAKYTNGTNTIWAMMCLNALVGGIAQKGGLVYRQTANTKSWNWTGSPADLNQTKWTLTASAGFPHVSHVPAEGHGVRWLIPYAILNGLPSSHPDFRKVPTGPYNKVLNSASNDDVTGNVYGGGTVKGGGGIRGLVVFNTDPFIADSNTSLWEKALPKLDFAVAIDLYLTSTHELFPAGSVVLPECTMLERISHMTPDGPTPVINLQQKVVEPLHQCKSAQWIFVKLAEKMSVEYGVTGTAGYFAKDALAANYTDSTDGNGQAARTGRLHKMSADQGDELFAKAALDGAVPATGQTLTWANAVANGGFVHPNWNTSSYPVVNNISSVASSAPHSGKFRFSYAGTESNGSVRGYRQVVEKSNATSFATPTVPKWIAPAATSTQYPLRFMAGGKVMWHTMGATANLSYLVQDFDKDAQVRQTNCLLINPADATARGIVNGSWVIVASAAGRVRVQAMVTERIQAGYVSLFSGYGHKAPTQKTANNRGVNPNRIISTRYDLGSLNDTSNEEPVQVFKA